MRTIWLWVRANSKKLAAIIALLLMGGCGIGMCRKAQTETAENPSDIEVLEGENEILKSSAWVQKHADEHLDFEKRQLESFERVAIAAAVAAAEGAPAEVSSTSMDGGKSNTCGRFANSRRRKLCERLMARGAP